MLRATWRRLGSPAWLAIGLVMILPALAEAQLFPNRTIRRERPNCASEPPFNKQVRQDYFGYYPTCWRAFPQGWACPCPNPELPNAAASFAKIPFNQRRTPLGDEAIPGMDEENPDGMGEGPPGTAPADNPNSIPLPNPSRSPFDLDTNPRPPASRPNADPFETNPIPPRSSGPANPPANSRPSTGLMEMPQLPSTSTSTSMSSDGPTLSPGSMVMAPDATLASNTTDSRPDLGPLPSAPRPNSSVPTASDTLPILTQPTPTQAPRRRSLVGRLFGSGNTQNR